MVSNMSEKTPDPTETKPLKEGAIDLATVKDKVEPTGKRTVIPYDKIVKALKKGKAYVLKKGVNRNTVRQALYRLQDKEGYNLPDTELGKIQAQFIFYKGES